MQGDGCTHLIRSKFHSVCWQSPVYLRVVSKISDCEFNVDKTSHEFCNLSLVGRIMVSKDVSYLTARTCGYVALHGRKNFVDVIKVK